jgi:hypothetical protein
MSRTASFKATTAPDGTYLMAQPWASRDRPVARYSIIALASTGTAGHRSTKIGEAHRCEEHPRRFHLLAIDGERLTDWRAGLAMCGGDCTSLTDGMRRLAEHDTQQKERATP